MREQASTTVKSAIGSWTFSCGAEEETHIIEDDVLLSSRITIPDLTFGQVLKMSRSIHWSGAGLPTVTTVVTCVRSSRSETRLALPGQFALHQLRCTSEGGEGRT